MTQNTEQDRAEFEARFKHLDLTQEPDAWGAPQYKHDAISLAWSAWQAARHTPEVTVPQSIEQMAVDRYKVVPSHESMFHRWAVVAGNGTQQLYIGREVECLNMARKFAGAFLDGAFVAMQNTAPAHPAEGVPAQDAEAKIAELLALARIMVRTALDADNKTQVQEIKAAIESEVAFERALRAALANTQPAAQGLDAGYADANRLIGRLLSSDPDFADCTEAANLIRELTQNGPDGFATWKDAAVSERVLRVDMQRVIRALPRVTYGYKSDGEGRYLTSYESSEGQFLRHADVMAAIAAQAKQGGAA